MYTHCEDTKGNVGMWKLKTQPFDRMHRTSYSVLVETTRLPSTIF